MCLHKTLLFVCAFLWSMELSCANHVEFWVKLGFPVCFVAFLTPPVAGLHVKESNCH